MRGRNDTRQANTVSIIDENNFALRDDDIVDQKVENLLGVLEWNIAESTDIKTTFDSLFSWE